MILRLLQPVFFLSALFATSVSFAQARLEGVVTDSLTGQPVPYVTVYFANTSIGASTGDDGKYVLTNIPVGTYDLIFSLVGYEKISTRVSLNAGDKLVKNAKLVPLSKQLTEVVVKPGKNKDWKRCFSQFKKDFLGYSPNARKCTILKPELLNFNYDKETGKVTGSSYGFFVVENKALGYRIKYELNNYIHNKEEAYTTYYGNALFEEMPAKDAKQKKAWEKKRLEAYRGSLQHFIKSLLAYRLGEEGFVVSKSASLEIESVLLAPEILKRTQYAHLMALTYSEPVYVTYKNEAEEVAYRSLVRSMSVSPGSQQTSQLRLKEPVILSMEGFIYNPLSLTRSGYWGYENTAELVPLDYKPTKK